MLENISETEMNPPSEFLIRHISITRSRHPDIKCRKSDRHGLGCEFIEILPGRTDLQVWGQSIKIQFPLIIFSHQSQMKSLILKTMVTKVQTHQCQKRFAKNWHSLNAGLKRFPGVLIIASIPACLKLL